MLRSDKDTVSYHYRRKDNIFDVNYLNPGKYVLYIKAYKNGVVKDKVALNIVVPFAFFENPVTNIIIVSFVLIGLAAYIFYRKEMIKKKAAKQLTIQKLKNEKEKLKVQAIINNFNPHLINNSLHWVQSRYYKDKKLIKMIGRLSDNINTIFFKTKKGQAFHSLEDELKMVNNYMEIQKLRFGDTFEFIVNDEDDLKKHIRVIVMQVQIYVENAVEHGLRNRKDSGFVKIDIYQDKNFYFISITDDGIGRTKAKKLGSRGLQSGLKMLEEIYAILNNNQSSKYKITAIYFDDIFNEEGQRYGTKVVISLPKEFDFNRFS